jgi:hypothetical protein
MGRPKKFKAVEKAETVVIGDLVAENARLKAQVISLTQELEVERAKRKKDRKRLMEKENNLT